MTSDVNGGLEHLGPPPSAETALASLAAPLRDWFREHIGEPTPAQRLAWPALRAGKNLLLAAPTGGGKTLAAFLPILDALLSSPFSFGVSCLYVGPLKALANDVRRNLRRHLHGLRGYLPPGQGRLRVGLRTGDTSAPARRGQRLDPPDILLTTPESLAVLLSQPACADLFGGLRWVVVDEVHALAPNKRGADLALSLERLTELAGGSVQRVGLSATCTPLAEATGFLAGVGRSCAVAAVADTTPLELAVELLPAGGNFLEDLLDRLEPELAAHGSTLIFANTRGLAERLAWALRRHRPDWDGEIAVHHSALAAVRRLCVERRFKHGRLRAVVTSTSLELGIDVGSVELVVLVHPPGGVVRLLQRVGRSGHGPGRPRRGLVLAASAADLLEAAVTAASSRSAQCEPLRVAPAPLDVLCQQLLGMAAQRPWSVDEALTLARRAYPYRNLDEADFDDCLRYLSGRRSGEDADVPTWLPARLARDGGRFRICDQRTARLVRRNLGTIIADEPRLVRFERPDDSGRGTPSSVLSTVGQVDEAFADRLQPGDRFLLDGRCLEFRRRDGAALLVDDVPGRPAVPRWGGEGQRLSAELARRLFLLRVRAGEALLLGPAALRELLRRDYDLAGAAADALAAYFERQECVSEIPDATGCLVEAVHAGSGADYYVHTPLNRAGNDALARVAVVRLARDCGRGAASLVADLGFALLLRGAADLTPDDLRRLLAADDFNADLEAALADGVTLRARFRRVALTGLMLLRHPPGGRRRVGGLDWAERRLFDQVRAADPDFVLLRQAVREVCDEDCDAAAARDFVEQLPRRVLRCRWLAQPSPFAEAWTQLGAGPAETVEDPAEALRRLHAALTGGGSDRAG
jgi:ATP-dependent Lhr-like helicase